MSGGGVPAVSEARQTTTPPVSLNLACVDPRRALRAWHREQMRPAGVQRDQARKLRYRRRPRAGDDWCGAQSCRRKSPRSRAPASRSRSRRRRSRAGTARRARRQRRARRSAAAQTVRSIRCAAQCDEIAGRDDHGEARHDQHDAGAADDGIETEQAGDQDCAERRREREEIDEVARERLDRRAVDDRRLLALRPNRPVLRTVSTGIADRAEQQPAEQPGRVQRAGAEIGELRQGRQHERIGAHQPDGIGQRQHGDDEQRKQRVERRAACGGRARSRARRRRSAAAGRSRPASSAAAGQPRSTRRTRHCRGAGR